MSDDDHDECNDQLDSKDYEIRELEADGAHAVTEIADLKRQISEQRILLREAALSYVALENRASPMFTRHDDDSVTVEFPEPPLTTYWVSHEYIQEWVDLMNEATTLRKENERLRANTIIEKIKVLGIDYERLHACLEEADRWGELVHSFEYLAVLDIVETAMRVDAES